MTNLQTLASNHRLDNQKPISGLHSISQLLYLVQFDSEWSLYCVSSKSQLFNRNAKSGLERKST